MAEGQAVIIECDTYEESIAAEGTGTLTAVASSGAAMGKGLCRGYHIQVSAADAHNTAVPVKFYDGNGGPCLYSTTVNLSEATQDVDSLGTFLPFFNGPFLQVGPVGATAGALTYRIIPLFEAF